MEIAVDIGKPVERGQLRERAAHRKVDRGIFRSKQRDVRPLAGEGGLHEGGGRSVCSGGDDAQPHVDTGIRGKIVIDQALKDLRLITAAGDPYIDRGMDLGLPVGAAADRVVILHKGSEEALHAVFKLFPEAGADRGQLLLGGDDNIVELERLGTESENQRAERLEVGLELGDAGRNVQRLIQKIAEHHAHLADGGCL